MEKLSSKNFVFIAGVEGSGTTILLELLSQVDGFIALGGNYYTPEFDVQRKQLNEWTKELWRYPQRIRAVRKEAVLKEISELSLPEDVSHVLYKRSYPFTDQRYFPNLLDLKKFSSSLKLIVMHRNLRSNARSMLRRGFEKTIEKAQQRAIKGREILDAQLREFDGSMVEISYENLIGDQKEQELRKIEEFLNLPDDSLVSHKERITGPSAKRLPED